MSAPARYRVGILLFDEVEVLDACGTYEVFSVASRVSRRDRPAEPVPVEVVTLTPDPRTAVRARGGLRLVADSALTDAQELNVVLVPGGVTTLVERDSTVLAWLRQVSEPAQLTASVCTGAFVLAEAGLLGDGPVTTHWEDVAELRQRFPALEVLDDVRWVDNGRVATSAGVSAGIDLALHLVARLVDDELAAATARQMDYLWQRQPEGAAA